MLGLEVRAPRGRRINAVATAIGFVFPGQCDQKDRLIFLGEHIRLHKLNNPVFLRAAVECAGAAVPSDKPDSRTFYRTPEWRRARMQALKRHGSICQSCGAVAGRGVRIVVRHIQSVCEYWNLRLEISNLEVLCEECALGRVADSQPNFTANAECRS